MALPRYRCNETSGTVIKSTYYPFGAEFETHPAEPPHKSWVPLNDEARAAFVKADVKPDHEDPAPVVPAASKK